MVMLWIVFLCLDWHFWFSPGLLNVSPTPSLKVQVMSVYLVEEGKVFPWGKKQW